MARVPPAVAFVACTFIWGTTWLAIKIGYGGLDAVWGACLRFTLAALIAMPLLLSRPNPIPRGGRQIGVVLWVGFIMFGADYGLIYWGEQWISSGLTAVLFATLPLFIALFTQFFLHTHRATPRHLLGVAVGLVGVGCISFEAIQAGGSLGPVIAIVLSAACAAGASVAVKRWGGDLQPLVLNTWAMLIGAPLLLVASLLLNETPSAPANAQAWGSLMYLVVFGSIVSFLLYWDLLKKWGPNRAGLIPIATPVVAIFAGILVGESLTLLQWIGSAIVLGGVAVSLLPGKMARSASEPAQVAPMTGK